MTTAEGPARSIDPSVICNLQQLVQVAADAAGMIVHADHHELRDAVFSDRRLR